MKYKIRKRENVTLYLSSEVAELDDEYFRNLKENPYTGNSEEDFLSYIDSLYILGEDCVPRYIEDYSVYDELEKLGVCDNEFASSAEKGRNMWLELGHEDDQYHKYGGFVVEATNRH
jgi:hypothetical protein